MKDIRKILHFVKPYWKLAVLALVLLTSLVFMDLTIPRLIEQIIDQGIKQQSMVVVGQTSLLMLGISVLSTITAIGNNYFSVRVGESVGRDLREALFVKIQNFSYGNSDRFTTGKLMVRLTSDAGAVQRLVQISLRIGTRAPLLIIGSLFFMFKTSPALSLTMIPLLLITSTVIIFFGVKMEPMFRTVQQKLDKLNTVLQENIAGVRLVKAYVRADYENEHFELANQDLTEHTIKVMQFMSIMSPVLTVFINLGMVLVIWSGGLQAIQGNMTIGQIVAFTNYLLITMTPLIMMTMLSNTWANGIASAKRVNEVLDTIPDVLEKENAKLLPGQTNSEVVFNNVSFHYNGSSEGSILKDINLLTKPGKTVAILGSTGSGKSSLVNLIPRFYDVTSGQILISGLDVRDLKEDSLLSHIGFVPQETILFSGTIRENICYGFPQATDEEVIAAAKAAQAHDFIINFPKGYDSHVEERGNNLSGGQKQRIAIARAIILNPMILILDDSTSSVDVETEIKIQTAMGKMMRGQTSFVVAQRISTVLNADKIIVIDKGRIAAQGTHTYLIKTSSIYQEIYDSQLGNGFQMAKSKKTRRSGSQS